MLPQTALFIQDTPHHKKLLAKTKHLGLFLLLPKNKSEVFNDIKNWITTKLISSQAKLLSQVARTTLITLVMPSYETGVLEANFVESAHD